MMSSTLIYKPLTRLTIYGIVFLSVLFGCRNQDLSNDEYEKLCPFERKYGGWDFYLEAPFKISPHKKSYSVGDTMLFVFEFPDRILDLSRETSFVIKDFPFIPHFFLYRFENDDWYSGLNENEFQMDTLFYPQRFGESSQLAAKIAGKAIYSEPNYRIEFKLILKKPGRYVTFFIDQVEGVDKWDIKDGLFPEYQAIGNDSGCPEPHHYQVCYILNGDPHYADFSEEMKFLDERVYKGRLGRLGAAWDDPIWGGLDENGGTQRQSINVDWHGVFGFEVVE